MEIHERKAVSDELKKYDHLAKDSDFIEVQIQKNIIRRKV